MTDLIAFKVFGIQFFFIVIFLAFIFELVDSSLGMGYGTTLTPILLILGVVRLIIEPDGRSSEIAFIVADPWQGQGLGPKMLGYMIEISKEKKT
jgi:hypothetical protein